MDHITYPTSAAACPTDQPASLHLSLAHALGVGALVPGLDQESPQLGPISILLQHVVLLLVDENGNEHQVRILIPAQTWEEILRENFAQWGLKLVQIDKPPGETRMIVLDLSEVALI